MVDPMAFETIRITPLHRGPVLPTVLPYTPYQDDLGRHAASLDRLVLFGLVVIG